MSEPYRPIYIKTATLQKYWSQTFRMDMRATLTGGLRRDVTELVTTKFAEETARNALSMAIEICGKHKDAASAAAEMAEKLAEWEAQEKGA